MKNWFIKQHSIVACLIVSSGTGHWNARLNLLRGDLEVQQQLMQRPEDTVACKQNKLLITYLHWNSLCMCDHALFYLLLFQYNQDLGQYFQILNTWYLEIELQIILQLKYGNNAIDAWGKRKSCFLYHNYSKIYGNMNKFIQLTCSLQICSGICTWRWGGGDVKSLISLCLLGLLLFYEWGFFVHFILMFFWVFLFCS